LGGCRAARIQSIRKNGSGHILYYRDREDASPWRLEQSHSSGHRVYKHYLWQRSSCCSMRAATTAHTAVSDWHSFPLISPQTVTASASPPKVESSNAPQPAQRHGSFFLLNKCSRPKKSQSQKPKPKAGMLCFITRSKEAGCICRFSFL
jgi:hypothetical protein